MTLARDLFGNFPTGDRARRLRRSRLHTTKIGTKNHQSVLTVSLPLVDNVRLGLVGSFSRFKTRAGGEQRN